MSKIIRESLFSGQVLRFTLNSPRANILDGEMMGELDDYLKNVAAGVKLIQFTGSGSHFSFGASVEEHTREKAPQMLRQFHGLFKRLISLSVPSMALVSGQCLGGGLELALMCNFLMLDKSAILGQPEINLGVFAPPASLILPLKIGQTSADEILLSGKIMSPEQFSDLGLVLEIFEDRDSMLKGAEKWISINILKKSASSLRFAVRAARTEFNAVLIRRLDELARIYENELMATKDANEGLQAFLEKRTPNWLDS
ncbi:MAG: enoyl-CoA hydratase-related protein [Candidatus Neomarinimicrobiota bacterium]